MRRYHGPFRPSGAFYRHQFSADYTISMFGFDFRQGQVAAIADLGHHRWLRLKVTDGKPNGDVTMPYGLLILRHGRRQMLWLGVTAHPTAEWIARQLTEACGWEPAPRYIVRDRDRAYGEIFTRRLRAMGIRDRPTAPRSPWQNGHTERLIGSIRRECLDHVVVFGERHLRHILLSYMRYYNSARTHLSLNKDAPTPRAVQAVGRILPAPILGELHHHYVRI